MSLVISHLIGIFRTATLLAAPLLFLAAAPTFAQDEDGGEAAPPAMKRMCKGERTPLNAETGQKDRVVLGLQLMNARLKRAETLNSAGNFLEMYTEFGALQAIMDDTLQFLLRSDGGGGRVLRHLKRFEIGIRGLMPRVELIRREIPLHYEPYMRDLLRDMSKARSRAIEPFFGNTVVPNTDS